MIITLYFQIVKNKFIGNHDIHNPSDHDRVFPNCKKINWKQSVDNSKVCLNMIIFYFLINQLNDSTDPVF